MIDTQHLFHARLAAWLDKLNEVAPTSSHSTYAFAIDPPRKGQRYARIVMSINGGSRSVHAFYDLRTGDVYKAAGWKAPAKHIRFNLLDDASFGRMMDTVDWTGGYLYMR